MVPQGGYPCRSVAKHRSVVNRHIVPALGRLPLAAVERRHVIELHESLCATAEMANMAVDVLTHMYALAKGWGIVAKDCNACQSIPVNPKHIRERFLTDAEFTRLGQVLDEVSGKGSQMSVGAVATIRLLMLTGCRRKKVLTLRWEHVDLDTAEIHIADGKTGTRTVQRSRSVGIRALCSSLRVFPRNHPQDHTEGGKGRLNDPPPASRHRCGTVR